MLSLFHCPVFYLASEVLKRISFQHLTLICSVIALDTSNRSLWLSSYAHVPIFESVMGEFITCSLEEHKKSTRKKGRFITHMEVARPNGQENGVRNGNMEKRRKKRRKTLKSDTLSQ